MPIIEWRREPRRIRLPVLILRPSPVSDLTGEAGTALIDTGSTVSGVALRTAVSLGLKRRGRLPLGSAQGLWDAERYAFRIGVSPDYSPPGRPSFPFVFDEVIGIELPDAFEFDALLGMDVLGQCDFAMNRRGACRLAFG
jgi:hypothetical protein